MSINEELKKTKDELHKKLKEKLHIKVKGEQVARTSKFARDNIERKLNEKPQTKAIKHILKKIEEKNEKEYLADGCECFITDD
jgi:hypothetical protein